MDLAPARREPVGGPGERGMARPDIVLRDHYPWSMGPGQREDRQTGTNGHEWRMDVYEVEVVRAEHSAQTEHPPGVP